MTDTEEELTDVDRQVLEVVLKEGRVNARLVTERTDVDAETATTALERLVAADVVNEVTTDLYEPVAVPDDEAGEHEVRVRGIPEIPNEQTMTAPIDPTEFEEKTDDGS